LPSSWRRSATALGIYVLLYVLRTLRFRILLPPEHRPSFGAAFAKAVPAPLLANMTEFGKTPHLTADEFGAMGYNLVIYPVSLQRVAMKASEEALHVLKREKSLKSFESRMQNRQELYDLLGYDPNA
jgi:2-methylisocitrate lyase-like PEP mutase family enzyme